MEGPETKLQESPKDEQYNQVRSNFPLKVMHIHCRNIWKKSTKKEIIIT